MRRRVLPVWLALVATDTGVLLTATPSEASAAKAQLSWVSSSGPSGVIDEPLSFMCYSQYRSLHATAITSGGEHIASDTVQSPCLTSVP